MAQGITSQPRCLRNAKREHTLRYKPTHASTRIIKLENRCTGNRTIVTPRGAHSKSLFGSRLTVSGVCFSQRLFADQCLCLDHSRYGIRKDLRVDRLC